MNAQLSMTDGTPSPLGVFQRGDGLNIAVVSQNAARIFFCVFDATDEKEICRLALPQRSGDVHFGFVSGLGIGTRYGFRAEGPWDEALGHRFDIQKLLVDPYASEIDRPFTHSPELLKRGFDTAAIVPKSIVTAPSTVATPLPPANPSFIYELQVRAFTKLHPDVPPEKRGTVAGLAHPAIIDHLLKLGVDTVELMPLAAWIDERHLPSLGLTNAWGYNPVTFMAPDPRLAPGGFAEIRNAVEALHSAGIRVILDIVLNHTGESDEEGATLSMRGLDNALYYARADGRLVNHTGCGNTVALDRTPVMQLALDALHNWVNRTGIDGFRFDLATVMGRSAKGFSTDAPLIAAIEQDPVLSKLMMIAEPWDVGPDGYRLGQFPPRWHEWNDRFCDDVRRFWRGDRGSTGNIATRLAGSSDIFGHRQPSRSINYVAAHDGFTLRDAVTFSAKDNHANGEGNRDGSAHEVTWVGGDVKTLLATLFLSRGTPMLTAGDEMGRTQRGNNNAYAQDNTVTWLDWKNADEGLIAFTAKLAELRKNHPLLSSDRFLTAADATWLGADGAAMDWNGSHPRVLGLVLVGENERLAVWINGGVARAEAALQPRDGYSWARIFCSAEGPGLPGHSVSLFIERRPHSSGVPDETLLQLATAAGVERQWWEIDGTHHAVSPESLRVMLTALRVPHATPEDARES
ncbi:MAG: glycogen debranching protein GlgX, partial [Rhizobiales bacterium]|nr:glycogen debranching protein GlgX [Hyphomicrobiales bacterium]